MWVTQGDEMENILGFFAGGSSHWLCFALELVVLPSAFGLFVDREGSWCAAVSLSFQMCISLLLPAVAKISHEADAGADEDAVEEEVEDGSIETARPF
jgi:hypothetical protein